MNVVSLHSVCKQFVRGRLTKTVLENVSWGIERRSSWIILGQPGSGKTTLLNIICGLYTPSVGWVERVGVISSPGGYVRLSRTSTPRQLATRLARYFGVDPQEVVEFVRHFSDLADHMDFPTTQLSRNQTRNLNYGLIYGLPFDLYLFDGAIASRGERFSNRCRAAFEQRQQTAAMIVATSKPRFAQQFAGNGAVLHRGKLYVFASVKDAIEAYNSLPPPPEYSEYESPSGSPEEEEEEFI